MNGGGTILALYEAFNDDEIYSILCSRLLVRNVNFYFSAAQQAVNSPVV